MHKIDDKQAFILKLRRFSIGIGLILFAYAIAGVQLKPNAEIALFGFPMTIKKPNLIGVTLLLSSLYSSLRYLYCAILIGPSPRQLRNRLLNGQLPDGTVCSQHQEDELKKYALEYFPKIGKYSAFKINYLTPSDGSLEYLSINSALPWQVRVFCCLEDIDYFSPLWVNAVAIYFFYLSTVL